MTHVRCNSMGKIAFIYLEDVLDCCDRTICHVNDRLYCHEASSKVSIPGFLELVFALSLKEGKGRKYCNNCTNRLRPARRLLSPQRFAEGAQEEQNADEGEERDSRGKEHASPIEQPFQFDLVDKRLILA